MVNWVARVAECFYTAYTLYINGLTKKRRKFSHAALGYSI